MEAIITEGDHTRRLQTRFRGKRMSPTDLTYLNAKIVEVMQHIPDPYSFAPSDQGLLLGMVQSGKTAALTASIAMAADNRYRFFIVVTSDNNNLYDQTLQRLQRDLPALRIYGKEVLDSSAQELQQEIATGVVLVISKNASVLTRLKKVLQDLEEDCGGTLPACLFIDDEADEASLDNKRRARSRIGGIGPSTIYSLLLNLRKMFSCCAYLEVTATPQALFLQNYSGEHRPHYTVLLEPGKGYVGGNTFFALVEEREESPLLRYIEQNDIDEMLESDGASIPKSLEYALCTFFVGATLKSDEEERANQDPDKMTYMMLCHVSHKKNDHAATATAVRTYYRWLRESLSSDLVPNHRDTIKAIQQLQWAYDDLQKTASKTLRMSFEGVVDELRSLLSGTTIQVINSDFPKQHIEYIRRYNIIIGGEILSRGITIENLLVTYYGRQAEQTSIDTMLQHARMYGYRSADLDVTRLYVTADIENRFRTIHESEQALWNVIRHYPDNEQYRGILIAPNLRPTRPVILDDLNTYSYAGGSFYFPHWPLYTPETLGDTTQQIDERLAQLKVQDRIITPTTLDEILFLIQMTRSDASNGGTWRTELIITALESLRKERGASACLYLQQKAERKADHRKGEWREIRSVVSGDVEKKIDATSPDMPALVLARFTGTKDGWAGIPFWVPDVRFPDGAYAFMFNRES